LFCMCLTCLMLAAASTAAQQRKPIPIKPDAPGLAKNHRLILKEGTYQVVSQYQNVGYRVRYMSLERGGDWEELPADLVDWPATEKWEKSHAEQPEDTSPAMKEAQEIEKEAMEGVLT